MAELNQIRRERAADSIYDALRQAILDHAFRPGERLDVQSLARKFDVSPTPVKSAIQMLATVGLVDIRPRSGTFVARSTAGDVAETFDIRRALECLAAETAVVNLSDDVLRHIAELIERMRARLGAQPHYRYNTEFHRTLIQLSGNRKLLEMYDDLNAHIRIARIHSFQGAWQARVPEEHAEHLAIFMALKDRNACELIRCLTKHIDRAKNILVESLKGNES